MIDNGMNNEDTYEMWKRTGQLEDVKKFVKTSIKHLATKREIAEHLGVSEKTVIFLRKKHPDFDKAFQLPKLELKSELIDSMMKLALGYEEVTETQDITDGGKSGEQKRKVNRVKKQVGPNYKAIIYLLTKHCGNEYSDKYDELRLMEKRLSQQKEGWINESIASDTNENSGD